MLTEERCAHPSGHHGEQAVGVKSKGGETSDMWSPR